jgi:predicted GNAT family acetyltransferase
MQHPLDNPAFNALISNNKHLANGTEQAKHFADNVAPFVGLRDNSDNDFQQLYELLPYDRPAVFIKDVEQQFSKDWSVLRAMRVPQMIFDKPAENNPSVEIVELTDEHIPQMLSLTKLTNPGPFLERTIEFGHYRGIFDGEELVAMAGQRMHAFNYAEISAVCTHPDYLGRGYARHLLLNQAHRIQAEGDIPYLHVLSTNERALKVYKGLGFAIRKEMYFYVLQKNPGTTFIHHDNHP